MTEILKDIFAGEVHKNAYDFIVANRHSVLWYMVPPLRGYSAIALPDGNYEFLFATIKAKENDWVKVVERYIYSGRTSYHAYKDYSGKVPESEADILVSAIESGQSALRSKGLDPSNNFVIIRKTEIQ